MPFKSKAQARFMFAKHPAIVKEFASKTVSIKSLPNKLKPTKVTSRQAKTMKLSKLESKLPKGPKSY